MFTLCARILHTLAEPTGDQRAANGQGSMMVRDTPLGATDYAWQHVARVGTGLGLTLLGLCRIIDVGHDGPVPPPAVAELVGKAPSTVARDLHALAERGIVVRVGGVAVGYTIDY